MFRLAASTCLRHTARQYSLTSTNVATARASFATATTSKDFCLSGHSSVQYGASETLPKETKKWSPALCKIVGTIGPTSEQLPVLQEVVKAGLRVMRLNFSHATKEEVELRTKNLSLCAGHHATLKSNVDTQVGNVRAILLDTRGPEIRTGKLKDDESGHHTIHLEAGETITLVTKPLEEGSTTSHLFLDYKNLHTSLKPGMPVLLDDGAVHLTVKEVVGEEVICTIDNSGELRSRAGVNLPGAETDMPAMSEQDKRDIKYGMTKDIDYVAASFVQSAAGVHEIRDHIKQCAEELGWNVNYQPLPLVISKIESVNGMRHFHEILDASDGIMVARGDLGVEIPLQQITLAQKEMVRACNEAGKPVIVATQMLESMTKKPRPTRAEVADVTNAVYDGADAVMLSGETAKGKFPVSAVKIMNEIILTAEKFASERPDLINSPSAGPLVESSENPNASLAEAAVTASKKNDDVTAILVLNTDGELPRFVSACRPDVPIVTFCEDKRAARQIMLFRGIHPIVVGRNQLSAENTIERTAVHHAKEMGVISSGDSVVIVSNEDCPANYLGTMGTIKTASVP